MKSARAALVVALLCAPALAGDGEPAKQPPAPAPAPAPAAGPETKPAAKPERKVDAAAMKALERHLGLVHLPASAGLKEVSGKGSIDQDGVTIGLEPTWSADKGFDIGIVLSEQAIKDIKDQIAAQGVPPAQIEKIDLVPIIKQQIGMTGLNAAFEAPGKNWEHFDISFKQQGDDQIVDLVAFDDKADADSRQYVFGKDGLLKSSSTAPKSDTPMGQQMKQMGVTFESTMTFEKKGERYLLSSRTLSVMGQEAESKFTYFDGPNGSFLPKVVVVTSPMQGEQTIQFHDYTVDGKVVESTKPVEKPAAKPEERKPAAPADKPADTPPAPTPPEPKDGK